MVRGHSIPSSADMGSELKIARGVHDSTSGDIPMNNIIYIVGLVVIVVAVLSFLGLR
jgi:hypothetical protein